MGRVVKRVEMLRLLYKEVVEGRSEFAWRDFFVMLAPVASHAYIQNTLYNLMGRGVLVKLSTPCNGFLRKPKAKEELPVVDAFNSM